MKITMIGVSSFVGTRLFSKNHDSYNFSSEKFEVLEYFDYFCANFMNPIRD